MIGTFGDFPNKVSCGTCEESFDTFLQYGPFFCDACQRRKSRRSHIRIVNSRLRIAGPEWDLFRRSDILALITIVNEFTDLGEKG